MTYIGNPQGTGFSKIDSQQFSGTGSATAFTMSVRNVDAPIAEAASRRIFAFARTA